MAKQLAKNDTPSSNIIKRSWYKKHTPDTENYDGCKSQTIPDASMSVTEMLQRTKRGLPISSGKNPPVYNGEKLLPNWQKLDLIDRQKLIQAAAEDVKVKKERRDKQQKAVDELKAKKAADEKEEFLKQAAAAYENNVRLKQENQSKSGA